MSSSPLAAMLLPALMKSVSSGGGAGSPATSALTGGGGPSPDKDIGAAVSSEYSQLQGVDPGKIMADLNGYKQAISALFPIAVTRVADAAKGISQAVTGLNSAIKAFEKAQETLKNVHPPLGIQAAQQSPQSGPTPFGPQSSAVPGGM